MILDKRKKVLILYLGGVEKAFENSGETEQWLERFSEMQMMSQAEIAFIGPRDKKEELQAAHLKRTIRRIVRDWNKYAGFIITLPYKTYLYHANLLSFMMGPIVEKPIICTTALRLTHIHRSAIEDVDLKANCINAGMIAHTGLAGISVVGGRYIMPASHALHEVKDELDILTSIDGVAYGEIDFGIILDPSAHIGTKQKPEVAIDIGEHVPWVDLHNKKKRASTIASLKGLKNTDGLIIDGGAMLDVSIAKALPKSVPSLLMTKAAVLLYERDRLLPIHNMSPEAAAGKFRWLLGQRFYGSLRSLFEEEYIGELLKRV